MKKIGLLLTLLIGVYITGSMSLFAQKNDKLIIKNDSMERDNTSRVKEKNIPDTSKNIQKDTTTSKYKSKPNKRNDMYVVPSNKNSNR